MTKHTPGPWEWKKDKDQEKYAIDSNTRIIMDHELLKLLADVVDALKEIVEFLEYSPPSDEDFRGMDEWDKERIKLMLNAECVIKKATGER